LRSEHALLEDILVAADRIARFIEGMDLDGFLADDKTQSAVVREVMVMGEAASQVPTAARIAYPDIPWQDLVQLRNYYIHVYHGVNYRRVWNASTRRVPLIRAHVAAALEALAGGGDAIP
jgi:uncharacterized protein with HEPN domain